VFDVVFKPDGNCVGVFFASQVCATRNVQFAFAGILVHTNCVPMLHPFSLAWVGRFPSGFVLATPVPGFVAGFQVHVFFYPITCKLFFSFTIYNFAYVKR
jgi:hypothetical protein